MPITEGGRFSPENRIVSPGVFTRENDLSGVAQGVADIGAVVVAPFPKGPGFSPTLVTNVNDLQAKFGVPDGVYYGPYTATEYLKQKGFVTVCRVGALTGYNQKHPLLVYAQSGTWNRNGSVGAINSGSSFVNVSGSLTSGSAGYLAGVSIGTSASSSFVSITTSSILSGTSSSYYNKATFGVSFPTSSFTFTFASSATDANIGTGLNSSSGSALFSGKTVQFGLYTGTTLTQNLSSSYTFSPSSTTDVSFFTSSLGTAFTSSAFNYLISGGFLSGAFANSVQITGGYPFDTTTGNVYLYSGSFQAYRGSCANPVIRIQGLISGSFGLYNGTFTSTATLPTIDGCGNLVTGSGQNILLAVLGDTQAGGIDTSLNVPGFLGSTLQSSSVLDTTSGSINQNYVLNLSSSLGSGYGNYEFSLSKATNKYITNVWGKDPTVGNPATQVTGQKIEAAYINGIFEDSIASIMTSPYTWRLGVAAPIELTGIFSSGAIEPLIFTDAYSLVPTTGDSAFSLTHAYTPWILSQAIAGVNGSTTRFQLFRAHTLSDGTNTNTAYKLEIRDVKLAGNVAGSTWGTFTLAVRAYSDTENRPSYLEQFANLTLDPTSPDFIARRIGDRYNYITNVGKILEFGSYNNLSKYIRIEISTNNYPVSAVPYGFNPYFAPFAGTVLDNITPTMKYTKASTWTNGPGKYASGIVFGQTLSSDSELSALYPTSSAGAYIYADNLQYFDALPANTTIGNNQLFALDIDYTGNGVGSSAFIATANGTLNSIPAINSSNEATYVKMRKFVLGFQGGFDGQSPSIPINVGSNTVAGNTQGLNCSTSTTAGSVAYNQCIGALSNADQFDINLIVTPGIFHSLHPYVAQLAIDLCETRGDCFYIMDNIVFPNTNQSVDMITPAINDVLNIDSNYVATYYPWLKVLDTNINQIVNLPPSVLMPSIYASNDAASAEWFAPAGLNRGGISQATGVLDRLTIADRDTLYLGRVNPIAQFPGQGICVWGQKTLQVKHSALDRVNVRRLLIALKKFIAASSKYLVFEQNVATTRNRFLSIVNPYLESVQQRSGLYAYKVVMDESNNTADIIDNNQLYGQIYLQPAKTAEFIILDFNILPTGASFPGV